MYKDYRDYRINSSCVLCGEVYYIMSVFGRVHCCRFPCNRLQRLLCSECSSGDCQIRKN